MRVTVALLCWVLDLSLDRGEEEPKHVADLGADRTIAVPDALLGAEGFGFYNRASG